MLVFQNLPQNEHISSSNASSCVFTWALLEVEICGCGRPLEPTESIVHVFNIENTMNMKTGFLRYFLQSADTFFTIIKDFTADHVSHFIHFRGIKSLRPF